MWGSDAHADKVGGGVTEATGTSGESVSRSLEPPHGQESFPFHFHSMGSLRVILGFSEVSSAVVELREKPRKTLLHRVVAPTGFEPVFQP